MNNIDKNILKTIKTPSYVVDKRLLKNNLEILEYIQDNTGCKILLALKGFSMHSVLPLIGEYLSGITSSSLHEAKLGAKYMGKEVHIYSPAYREDEFEEIVNLCDHIVFNSMEQYNRFKNKLKGTNKVIQCGLRINPEYSEVETEIYDPCAPNSRLGTVKSSLDSVNIKGIDGLHFHTMCEQGFDTLERTFEVVERKFGEYLYQMKWLNFGGGHHITKDNYDMDGLIKLIKYVMDKYDVMVYLEPGEAIALNSGYLVSSVLDVVENNMKIAILDTSAACHMPDVIEMPYRPYVIDSGKINEKEYTYRLGGMTCLAGDVIGDYSFDEPLKYGDKLIFTDMAHYTMVKNNMFNGINLPSIALLDDDGIKVIREFGFEDYESRLS